MPRRKKSIVSRTPIDLLSWAIILVMIITIPYVLWAQPQDKCEKELTEAVQYYENGNFDESINSVTACLIKGQLTKQDRIRAYRLLSLVYIATDSLDQARSAIRKLLYLEPKYEPDFVQDPPQFIDLVKEVKVTLPTTLAEKLFGGAKKWLWIGGGSAAVFASVLLLRGNKASGFPNPPGRP